MEDHQLQLNGKPVWLIKSSDQDSSGSSCDQCVFEFSAESYDPLACPRGTDDHLQCTVDENALQHFTDKDPSTAYSFPSERTSPVITNTALNIQVGGGHYKDMKIQPIEYIHANNLSFLEGNVVKYITRHKTKNKAQDIRKVIHYCELILQLEYNETYEQEPK